MSGIVPANISAGWRLKSTLGAGVLPITLRCQVAPARSGNCSVPARLPGIRRHLVKVASGSYLNAMRSVGLKVLKNKLSEYVRLAAAGEVVLVTDRDKVVAELGPPRQERSQRLADAQLAAAVREGWLSPPLLVTEEAPPYLPVAPLSEILAELDEDRGDR